MKNLIKNQTIITILFNLAQIAAFSVVASRLIKGALRKSKPSPDHKTLEQQKDNFTVSVIIPARNESNRIGECILSLTDQQVDEIIVVDDESSDSTPLIARYIGAKVITGQPLPPGWVGKPWALQQGLEAATGDIVIFLDADTRAGAELVSTMRTLLHKSYKHLVSLGASFHTSSPAETVLHASFLSSLIYRLGAIGTSFKPGINPEVNTPERILISGQCFGVDRRSFIAEGGFTIAKANMTDDFALAQALSKAGWQIDFLDGTDLIDVDMHNSTSDVWNEWGRSIALVDVSTKKVLYADLATIWVVMGLPVVAIFNKKTRIPALAALIMRFALCIPLARVYISHRKWVYLSPLADIATAIRLTLSITKPVKSWRGRKYSDTRISGQ